MTIATELARQGRLVDRLLNQGTFVEEVPLRLHDRSIDAGGAPEWHPTFVRYLASSGVCFCRDDPEWIAEHGADYHVCDKRLRTDRFRSPNHRMHPHRLKRALRQLRVLSKPAFEVVYPVLARGMTWDACRARIASDRTRRGETPHTDIEWAALIVSGLDLVASSY